MNVHKYSSERIKVSITNSVCCHCFVSGCAMLEFSALINLLPSKVRKFKQSLKMQPCLLELALSGSLYSLYWYQAICNTHLFMQTGWKPGCCVMHLGSSWHSPLITASIILFFPCRYFLTANTCLGSFHKLAVLGWTLRADYLNEV